MSDIIVSSGVTSSGVTLSNNSMTVLDGGIAINTTAKTKGKIYVSSGGLTSSATLKGGDQYVSNGGVASRTVISSGGWMEILSGGTAIAPYINNYGWLILSSGGSAINLYRYSIWAHEIITIADNTLYSSGSTVYRNSVSDVSLDRNRVFIIAGGGTATRVDVGSCTSMYVSDGGIANDTKVEFQSILYVSSGGTANNTNVKGYVGDPGQIIVSDHGQANGTILSRGGCMCLSGGTATDTTVNSGGAVYVSGGGTATRTTVNSGGYIGVFEVGSATEVAIAEGGSIKVCLASNTVLQGTSNGSAFDYRTSADNIQVRTNLGLAVGSGGIANHAVVSSGGVMHVSSGGIANSTTVSSCGAMYVSSGGVADSTRLCGELSLLCVYDGGIARNTNQWGHLMYISSGGVADGTTVGNGIMTVFDGGAAKKTSVTSHGEMRVSGGGVAENVNLQEYAYLTLWGGGSARNVICNGASVKVSGGGVLRDAIINDAIKAEFCSGCTATGVAISGGKVELTVAPDTYFQGTCDGSAIEMKNARLSGCNCADVYVLSGGVAEATNLNSTHDYTRLNVYSGGTAVDTTVSDHCFVNVYEGVASRTTVNAVQGNDVGMYVRGGGIAVDTTVNSGGSLIIFNGIHSGSLQIASGAHVSAYSGAAATIDFTVAKQTAPSTALINNWSLISGGANATYTITVKAAQATGTYLLANGAADFNQTITVKNTSDTELGTLTVGETKNLGGRDYTLSKSADALTLTVGAGTITPAVSDYNRSGMSDMIQFVNGLVYVTYDTDSGYVQTPAINDITGWNVTEIRRDLTGDGFADIQITSYDGASQTWVATLRNDYLKTGCITLNYQFIGAYETQLWSYLGSADFNADGKSEILMIQTDAGKDQYGHRNVAGWVTDTETCQWIDNIWLGSLDDNWDVAGTADVTGDGADNVLLRRADGMIGYWDKAGTNNIVELKNAGNRILLTTGDFDGDGAADFLWKSLDSDEFSVWSDLSGTFTDVAIGKLSDLGGNWQFAGVGDYNGDCKDEILWCDMTTYKTAYGEANKENFKNLTVIA